MIIPQAGLPPDLLPTVTAFISATPNLGGVLGVGVIGTGTSRHLHCPLRSLLIPSQYVVINNEFRSNLAALIGSGNVPKNINDAVTASRHPVYGQEVVRAYIAAFHLGFRILAGLAVFQLLLCLLLGPVVLHGGSKRDEMTIAKDDEITQNAPNEQHHGRVHTHDTNCLWR